MAANTAAARRRAVQVKLDELLGAPLVDQRWIAAVSDALDELGSGSRVTDAYILEGYVSASDHRRLLFCVIGGVIYTVYAKGSFTKSVDILDSWPSGDVEKRLVDYPKQRMLQAQGVILARPGSTAEESDAAFMRACDRHQELKVEQNRQKRAHEKAAEAELRKQRERRERADRAMDAERARRKKAESRQQREVAAKARRDAFTALQKSIGVATTLDSRIQAVAAAAGPPERTVELIAEVRRLLRRAKDLDTGHPVALVSCFGLLDVHLVESRQGTPARMGGRILVTDRQLLYFPRDGMRTYPLAGVRHRTEVLAEAHHFRLEIVLKLGHASSTKEWHLRTVSHRSGAPGDALLFDAALKFVSRQNRSGPLLMAEASDSFEKRPLPRLIRTTRDAEEVAAQWMSYLGFGPAAVTPPGTDGGLDVMAKTGVAQVKMEGLPTGRPTVQQLVGAAAVEKKQPVFFSLAGYTPEAVEWAERASVPLLQFDFQGTPVPVNQSARNLTT